MQEDRSKRRIEDASGASRRGLGASQSAGIPSSLSSTHKGRDTYATRGAWPGTLAIVQEAGALLFGQLPRLAGITLLLFVVETVLLLPIYSLGIDRFLQMLPAEFQVLLDPGFAGVFLSPVPILRFFLLDGPLFYGGLTILALRLATGRDIRLTHVFGALRLLLPLLVVNLGARILWVGGLAFAIVPGVFFFVGCSWALLLVVDREEEPLQALRTSLMLAWRHPGPTAGLCAVHAALWIVGATTCFGALLTTPLVVLIWTVGYRHLFGIERFSQGPSDPAPRSP